MQTSRTTVRAINRLACMSRSREGEGLFRLARSTKSIPRWTCADNNSNNIRKKGQQVRYFAINDDDDDDTKKKHKNDTSPPPSFVSITESLSSSLTGIGQVIFLNSPRAGAILLGSLAVGGDPFIPVLAATGAWTSTFAAQNVLSSSSSPDNNTSTAISSGLLQYNGVLVGCAAAVFCPGTLGAILATVTGSTAATMTTAAMSKMLAAPSSKNNGVPQFTWAFNFVTLTMLFRIKPFAATDAAMETASAVDTAISTTTAVGPSAFELLTFPLTGLSQIFLVQSPWSGLGVTAAIASYSPALAVHAIMGSTVGGITGFAMFGTGASADIAAGLYGFNSALTSMGVAVFCVDNTKARTLSVAGAAATAAVFAGLREVFALHSVPCLTLPFCITMTACYYLVDAVPGLHYAASPHSPEKNKQA